VQERYDVQDVEVKKLQRCRGAEEVQICRGAEVLSEMLSRRVLRC
jgi:hypothetical protein